MKMISRFLSKLHLIDKIILILAAIGLLFFVIFSRRKVELISIKLKVTDSDVLYAGTAPATEYVKSFSVGDTERNELGQIIAEITDVESYNISSSNKVTVLTLNVKATYNPKKEQYSLRGKPIIFGSPFTFNFSKVRAKGLIIEFPDYQKNLGLTEGRVTLKTQLRWDHREFSDVAGVPDYIAKGVKQGDEVKDLSGNVLAKILDVKIVPAKRTVINQAGSMVLVDDPLLKDVFYTIEIKTKEIAGRKYMFDYAPVLIGESVPINLPNISVFPTIMEIEK